MLVVTINSIPGKSLEALGLVRGSTIQSVNIGKDIGSAFKNLVGGELKNYNKMMAEARDIATDRLISEAQALGADAVVGLRYSTSAIMQSSAEVMAYGTAVKYIS